MTTREETSKAHSRSAVKGRIYERCEQSGAFRPEIAAEKERST